MSVPMNRPDPPQRPEEWAVANLRGYRVLGRISQGALADQIRDLGVPGFSRMALCSVENGNRRLTIDEMVAGAKALGVSLEDLLNPQGPGRWAYCAPAFLRDYAQA